MNTLYGKLALALAGLLLAIGLAYAWLGQTLTQRLMIETQQRFNRDLAARLVADQRLIVGGHLDEQALKATFERYMAINPSIEIYLLDHTGAIIAYSADPGVVKRNSVALEPIRALLAGDSGLPILGDDPRSHELRKSFSVTPVPFADRAAGYLYVVLRGVMYDSIERLYQDSVLVRISIWLLAGSLLFGLLAGLWLFNLLTRRLRRLARLMDDFRRSQFAVYTAYGQGGVGGDEIDQLGAHFDQLAERTQRLVTELQDRDALRRELVSNVSHDLRTPLTCLHGYLEVLARQEQRLSAGERRAYLHAAYGHSRRLSRLVDELFELAKLDARVVTPQTEPFAPAEWLHDIVQKFQLPAAKKHIALTFVVSDSATFFLDGDIALLERVMENLLSNALRHTPGGGRVTVELNRQADRAVIAVADSGAGIAAQELAQVFARGYRGSGIGAGQHLRLGLAIAQRIVELHHGELTVTSRPDQGTRFALRLPLR